MSAIPKLVQVRSEPYLEFVREQPCMICSRSPVEAAHFGTVSQNKKVHDLLAGPLCAEHHRTGKFSHHWFGGNTEKFEQYWCIDVHKRLLLLLCQYVQERRNRGVVKI